MKVQKDKKHLSLRKSGKEQNIAQENIVQREKYQAETRYFIGQPKKELNGKL